MNTGIPTHGRTHSCVDDMQHLTHRHDAHTEGQTWAQVHPPTQVRTQRTKTSSLTLCLAPSCTNKQEGPAAHSVWTLKDQGKSEVASMA